MAFLTDVTERDIIHLACEGLNCQLAKLNIEIRVTKKTGNKVRISIDADKDVRITKAQEPEPKRRGKDAKGNKDNIRS